MARLNNLYVPFSEMFERLLDQNYTEIFVKESCIQSLENTVFKDEIPKMFSFSMLKHLVHNQLDEMTSDYSQILSLFPRNDFIYYFYNMLDHKYVKMLMGITLKYVPTNIKLRIPFNFCQDFLVKNDKYPEFKWKMLSDNFQFKKFEKEELFDSKTWGKKSEDRFSIRLMSRQIIDLKGIIKDRNTMGKELKEQLKRVIINVHGGGFITMSSSSHQSYLRKFVRENDAILFSIDYPLAPKKKYKDIFESIIKGYLYITVK